MHLFVQYSCTSSGMHASCQTLRQPNFPPIEIASHNSFYSLINNRLGVMAYPHTMYGATDPESQVNPEVQQWFAAVDRDGSGRITAMELKAALANGQGGTFSDTACKLMIGMFDKEKNGTIDLVEFQALYNYINAWLGVFRGFDHDNSGTIQESELNSALTQMGYRLSPEFISFLIKKSDPTGHTCITIDQFIVLCVQIQRFTEAFRTRDNDQTGTISIGFEDFLGVALNCSI